MRKSLVTCFILLISLAVMAQQKVTVNLISSENSTRVIINGEEIGKVYKGVFQQKFSTLRSDSAYIHYATNVIEAFGHVIITQGDTLHIYADLLNYNDNTKIAILTNHVKMVDKEAILTTDLFNYNTATKVGNYTNGGKIVNKETTLTSQNGFYFSNTKDAYFRYNVVTISPDARILTDTMRYNTGTHINYFYGPTNIFGKKDKDTLYTENGTYNTKTEQAFFGKKNRYAQGTKSLKGDSLFYDKLKGYGKAINHITFEDTEQHIIMKGNLGEYYKADDRAVITQKPYVIYVTEEKDTTKRDTTIKMVSATKDSTQAAITSVVKTAQSAIADAPLGNLPPMPASLPKAKADSMAKVIAAMPIVKNTMPLATDKMKDSLKNVAAKTVVTGQLPNVKASPALTAQVKSIKPPAVTTAQTKPTKSQVVKTTTPAISDTSKTKKILVTADTAHVALPVLALTDTAKRIKRDTMYIGADTLETQIITYKTFKELQEQRRLAGIKDTNRVLHRPFVPDKTLPRVLERPTPRIVVEPHTYYRPLIALNTPVQIDTSIKRALKMPVLKKKPPIDSTKIKFTADSLAKTIKPPLPDTARIRILSAHHNVKIFKSDLQGKSDSLFYSTSDSIIRSFVKPIYWSQGAQLSGDTIYLQLKKNKPEYMNVAPGALLVYIEKGDSTHFNQMAGKRLQAYFKDSKLSKAVVTGNAETIYFNRKKNNVTEMTHSRSAGITINMKDGAAANLSFLKNPAHDANTISKIKEDDKILKGFIWKPKERPASKEDVINPKKIAPTPDQPQKGANGKGGAPVNSKPKGSPVGKDSVGKASPVLKPATLAKRDSSVVKTDSLKKASVIKSPKDTVVKKGGVVQR